MAEARATAKADKEWAEADRLRDAVAAAAWTLQTHQPVQNSKRINRLTSAPNRLIATRCQAVLLLERATRNEQEPVLTTDLANPHERA